MDYKYQGIILSKKDVGETDRIYTIYTFEAGKIRILGKGVRKPNAKLAGNLESVTLAEIFAAKSRGMGKITGAIAVNNFSNIKSDLVLTGRVFYAFRILGKIISEEEKDQVTFDLLKKYLETINLAKDENGADIVTLGLVFKVLDEMGYRIEVERCVRCGKKLALEKNCFSASRGGILCRKCQPAENDKTAISNESIKLLRIFLKNKLESLIKLRVDKRDVNNLKIIVQETINWMA